MAIVDAYKPKEGEEAITRFLAARRLSLLAVKGPCVIAGLAGFFVWIPVYFLLFAPR